MCGRQAGPKWPNLKKMLEEAFHPFRKKHTAPLRSNENGEKLFEQITAEERGPKLSAATWSVFHKTSLRRSRRGEDCHDGGIRMTRLWFATIACVISLGCIAQAEIAQAALEDLL